MSKKIKEYDICMKLEGNNLEIYGEFKRYMKETLKKISFFKRDGSKKIPEEKNGIYVVRGMKNGRIVVNGDLDFEVYEKNLNLEIITKNA